VKEHVFRYGENNRGLGMITLPENTEGAPVIVLLNAGLLHRTEPYRLNVLACRRLAEIGYICVRVDLSGKGDTPSRKGLINRESVALDWQFIKNSLEKQFGKRNFIIFGLCSGADNGIKIAAQDPAVKGLILLDAVSKRDSGFAKRTIYNKVTNISKWLNLHNTIRKELMKKINPQKKLLENSTGLRDEPTDNDMQQCFEGLVARKGRILAIFTSQALAHYNEKGQFCRVMSITGLDKICEETFWPTVDHLYTVQAHREQLLNKISDWCCSQLNHLRSQDLP